MRIYVYIYNDSLVISCINSNTQCPFTSEQSSIVQPGCSSEDHHHFQQHRPRQHYMYIFKHIYIYIYIYILYIYTCIHIYIYNDSLVISCIKSSTQCPFASEHSSIIQPGCSSGVMSF